MEHARIPVRLIARARVNEIAGERDGALLVRVTAPPVDGRANAALCGSEEHTSELQSRLHLVCRLLLEKKKQPTDDRQYSALAHHSYSTTRAHAPCTPRL